MEGPISIGKKLFGEGIIYLRGCFPLSVYWYTGILYVFKHWYTGKNMGKETTIKINKDFKEILRGEKKEGEDFESTLKRLIGDRKSDGIPEESQYT
ncbi:hypothetical protein LCGC14_2891390, partial [marine sediment metagenome]